MFGIPIEGPTYIFWDNEAVYKNTLAPALTLNKKHNSIAYHRCCEAVASRTTLIAKEGTLTNLSDPFTKTSYESFQERRPFRTIDVLRSILFGTELLKGTRQAKAAASQNGEVSGDGLKRCYGGTTRYRSDLGAQ